MGFGSSILTLVACVWAAFFYRARLLGDDAAYNNRWLARWAIKGVALPLILWVIFNSGFSDRMPPIFTFSNSPNFLVRITGQITPAFSMVGSYWCGITLVWLIWGVFVKSEKESRKDFLVASGIWYLLVLPVAIMILRSASLPALGYMLILCALPLTHTTMAMLVQVIPTPQYSRAIAAMKFGKYAEAEKVVIEQLEKCETDFQGWIMLAELYAMQFHDIKEAERTVYGVVNEPETTAAEVAVAFHKLADWHLKLCDNPTAAKRCLEEICQRYPQSHLAKMARLRINQIPEHSETLKEQQKSRTVHIPVFKQTMGGPTDPDATQAEVDIKQASEAANKCVEKLKADPNDVATREELARILAGQLDMLEEAMEQIELLIEMPEQSEKKIAEWLSMVARWQVKHGNDPDGARATLERLVHDYPTSIQAFEAQQQLSLVKEEERVRRFKASGARVEARLKQQER
jgi:tetratricopeptide (TPR) repeat protein